MPGRGSPIRGAGVDPEQLWLPMERPRLGRPPARTRGEITAAAIAIADAEGLAAVTMRAVATAVGVGTMSLYTYVPDKDTLVELMIEEVSGEYDLSAPPSGDWRADLHLLARAQHAIMHRHPWLPAALSARQTLGPNGLAVLEFALAALEPADVDGRSALEIVALLTGFVANYVTYEIAQQNLTERTGLSSRQLLDAQTRYLRKVVEGGRHPRLARALNSTATADQPETSFDRLLDRVINGLVSER